MPDFRAILAKAIERRRGLFGDASTTAQRILHGAADGVPGLFIERFGPGATLIRHMGKGHGLESPCHGADTLEALGFLGVRAVYDKPFVRDRSGLGDDTDSILKDPRPLAGDALPATITISENGRPHEVRLCDGFSTGLFLDQRTTRAWVHHHCGENPGLRVLNTFAYTGAFSVAAALGGAITTTVDVSARYLDWARRNFALNDLDPQAHHFARMDTFEFLGYAARKKLRYGLIVLDPPTFAAANKRRGTSAWSAARDYPRLVREACGVLEPGGVILASTNASELIRADRLERAIREGLGAEPRWLEAPAVPADFPGVEDRAHWRLFIPAMS